MYIFLYICLSLGMIGNIFRMIDAVVSRDGNANTRVIGVLWNMFGIVSSIILIVLFACR